MFLYLIKVGLQKYSSQMPRTDKFSVRTVYRIYVDRHWWYCDMWQGTK